MDSSFHTIRYIIFKNMYSVSPQNCHILLIWYVLNNDFNTNCKLAFKISIKTFSIRFFMHGTLKKGLKYAARTSSGLLVAFAVCSSSLNGREGLKQ